MSMLTIRVPLEEAEALVLALSRASRTFYHNDPASRACINAAAQIGTLVTEARKEEAWQALPKKEAGIAPTGSGI